MKRRALEPVEVAKKVIVLASGETERHALPFLLKHLQSRGISVEGVRIPPRNKALSVAMAEKLIKAAWYELLSGDPPDKFVVLLDVDGKPPDQVLNPFKKLSESLRVHIGAAIQCAYAQWHLEAWYFADARNLRNYLGRRALGAVDTTKPDEIHNPKHHLKNLLGDRVYTARVSKEIASRLDASVIKTRSPSFKGFLDEVMNGPRRGDGASNLSPSS